MALSVAEFADKLHEIMPELLRGFLRQGSGGFCGKDITPPQILILDFLNKNKEARMTDIANYMGVSTPAATGIVGRLVKAGLVLREFEPSDRRIIKIKLKAKGAGLIKKVMNERRRMIIDVFGHISEADREDYLRIISKVRDVLTGLQPKK